MKKKRKIHQVDQLSYMMERAYYPDYSPPKERNSCEIKVVNHDRGRIMVNINDKCLFPDGEETFQLIRAMHRCGTVQWGRDFHDRVQRYLDTVHIIGG
jgi:hypothetical protein